MFCYYIDRSVLSYPSLAKVAKEATKHLEYIKSGENLVLITCQRIEIITNDWIDTESIFTTLGCDFHKLEGKDLVFSRLIEIACGLRSHILGERFIFNQLESAVKHLRTNSSVHQLVTAALRTALKLRNKFQFYAEKDYIGIALDLLTLNSKGKKADTLIIAGSGMLGRSVATAALGTRFRRVILYTRSIKRARKYLQVPVEICSYSQLTNGSVQDPFCCFIATDDPKDKYRNIILDLIRSPDNRTTVDFSSIPLFASPNNNDGNYITMYNSEYLIEVQKNNEQLRLTSLSLSEHISHMINI